MSAQTNYSYSSDVGVAGGIYDLSPYAIDARRNECEDGVLKYGCGVVVGTEKGNQIKLPTATSVAADFEGIVVHSHTKELDMKGVLSLNNGVVVGVMKKGRIWARIADEVTPAYNDALYLIIEGDNAGLFTNTASSTSGSKTVAVANAKFIGGKGTGNVAPVLLA